MWLRYQVFHLIEWGKNTNQSAAIVSVSNFRPSGVWRGFHVATARPDIPLELQSACGL